MLAFQDFARFDFDVMLHEMPALGWFIARVAGHIMNSDGGASALGAIRRCAMPCQAMMKHDFAFSDGNRHNFHLDVGRKQGEVGHRGEMDGIGSQCSALVRAPQVTTRNDVHTAVFYVGVFECDPRAHQIGGLNHWPIGMILMPFRGSADFWRLVLHLIVPDTQGVRAGQIADCFANRLIIKMFAEQRKKTIGLCAN